jgi:RNA polymerase sigma factor (sigma-70 family)
VTRGEEFEQLRPLLFSIAYRIFGSAREAEDAVQETWLRYEASQAQPTSTKAFLSAAVTRMSIDVLRSARLRREEYAGQWFPEPLLTDPYQDPEHSAELADSISMAALLLLERLSPLERAVFVLRECSGSASPRSRRRWSGRKPRAASSRCGRAATWTRAGPGSRLTGGSARNSPRPSLRPSGNLTRRRPDGDQADVSDWQV